MAKASDLVGQVFGRLTVVKRAENTKKGKARWTCSCTCGGARTASACELKFGKTRSCGCLRSEVASARAVERNTTHGLTGTPAYVLYMSRKRQLSKLQRTPAWSEEEKILEFYNNCPDGHHVDHIIPLNGALVSGLHVLGNLQYLPAKVNLQKKNKFTPYTELSSPMAV